MYIFVVGAFAREGRGGDGGCGEGKDSANQCWAWKDYSLSKWLLKVHLLSRDLAQGGLLSATDDYEINKFIAIFETAEKESQISVGDSR